MRGPALRRETTVLREVRKVRGVVLSRPRPRPRPGPRPRRRHPLHPRHPVGGARDGDGRQHGRVMRRHATVPAMPRVPAVPGVPGVQGLTLVPVSAELELFCPPYNPA